VSFRRRRVDEGRLEGDGGFRRHGVEIAASRGKRRRARMRPRGPPETREYGERSRRPTNRASVPSPSTPAVRGAAPPRTSRPAHRPAGRNDLSPASPTRPRGVWAVIPGSSVDRASGSDAASDLLSNTGKLRHDQGWVPSRGLPGPSIEARAGAIDLDPARIPTSESIGEPESEPVSRPKTDGPRGLRQGSRRSAERQAWERICHRKICFLENINIF
jgi:hypothetical protein